MKREIAIIYGGKSCEHDISVITALHAYNAVNFKNYIKTLIYLYNGRFFIGEELSSLNTYIKFKPEKFREVIFRSGTLYEFKDKLKVVKKIDCALLCAHGGEGENGNLQGYLEINDIPYTSSKVFGSSLCMDKVMTKKMLEACGYPTLQYKVITAENNDFTEIAESPGYPVIVKPARLGSSIGIAKVKNEFEIMPAVELAFSYDSKLLIEKCLENYTEINCAALRSGKQVIISMLERPVTKGDFLSYEEKYVQRNKYNTEKEFPAKIDAILTEKIRKMTKSIYEDFELSGVVRIDYLIEGDTVYVNEINTIPGSLAYYLFSNQNISYSNLVERLVEESISAKKKEENIITSFYSNVLSNYKEGMKNSGSLKK